MESGEERKFLHDIASPLGTAMFLVDALLEDLVSKDSTQFADEIGHIQAIHQALQSAQKLLQERRELVIKRSSS